MSKLANEEMRARVPATGYQERPRRNPALPRAQFQKIDRACHKQTQRVSFFRIFGELDSKPFFAAARIVVP